MRVYAVAEPIGKIVPVIMSGGSGSRLWPLSREMYPKQFLPLASDRTMLQETAARFIADDFDAPMVICNENHRFMVAGQLQELGMKPHSIVLEPVGRNTAPAACLAALIIAERDPNAVMLMLASDHVIEFPERLRMAAITAREAALGGALVTFGIQPVGPETGYGYIKRGAADVFEGCFKVDKFVEKPDLNTAKKYLTDGSYFWNSGMFLFSPKDYLEELSKNSPAMIDACCEAIAQAETDQDFIRLDAEAFAASPSDSIDYAVMEHTARATVLPVDLGWNDVGGWQALWDIGDRDTSGNVIIGDVITQDVKNSYIRSESALVAVQGVDNLVVVATDDALMIADKDRAQDVKSIVEHLKSAGRTEQQTHTTMHRPWGWYQTIGAGRRYQVKQICLKPGASISLQFHHHRAEHWVVVEGCARVTRNEDVMDLQVNESVYIPIGATHRLENPFDDLLRIIEVQSGAYLGEDDIVRTEDTYGRV
jgi:mannose-1-phosphate guanylyltransferase / mannose-6-phosphate isomerase